MENNTQTLPQDVEELQAIIRSQLQQQIELEQTFRQEIAVLSSSLQETNKALQEKTTELQEKIDEVANLRYQLQKALMARFGRRTEKFSADQLNLFDEAALADIAVVEDIQQADEAITIACHTRKKSGRKPLPADLPREQIVHDLGDDEKICACGHALHRIGEDISEKLEFIPAQVKVIQHVRCKYACRACEGAVKMASLPAQPISKSIASPGLLAHVLVSKYSDHLPLYRQEQLLQRMGVEIARATLCFWVLSSAEVLRPLRDLLKEDIINNGYTQTDETPVQVLNEPNKPNTSKSFMWVYYGGTPDKKSIVYDYQPTRSGQAAADFLADFKGVLQTDGYGGYNSFDSKPNVIHIGCFAHCRRKFAEIIKVSQSPGKALVAVNYIRQLYAVEKESRENHLSHEQRYLLRQLRAGPVLLEFKSWLDETHHQVPPQSHISKAIAYALNQWPLLIRYIDYGFVEIDTNRLENSIRPFALGRRNWLFMGSDKGAEAGAIIYSLLATCKANLIEPYAYLKYVLDQLPQCKTDEARKKLLPYAVDPLELAKAYSQPTWGT
jgi:transposase